jgi:hypothetical protein
MKLGRGVGERMLDRIKDKILDRVWFKASPTLSNQIIDMVVMKVWNGVYGTVGDRVKEVVENGSG